MTRAIINAGGKGTRMLGYTRNIPKCLLEINGKSLLQTQIDTLRSQGIEDIVVITGYKSEKIQIPDVTFVKDTLQKGIVSGIFCAEEYLCGDVLISYADILFEKRILKKVLDSDADMGVLVDDDYWDYWKARMEKPETDVESMVIENGKIKSLGNTNCSPDERRFRYVGLLKFSEKGIETFKNIYHEHKKTYWDLNMPWMYSKSFKAAQMTCMMQAVIDAGHCVTPIVTSRGWLELDNTRDYELLQKWIKEDSAGRFFSFEK